MCLLSATSSTHPSNSITPPPTFVPTHTGSWHGADALSAEHGPNKISKELFSKLG